MAQPASPEVLQLKVVLADTSPPIWRRVLVPSGFTLARLHRVIQLAFGWEDSHLHRFCVHDEEFGPKEPEFDGGMRSERVALRALGLKARTRFSYEYDFGDGWEHAVTVEKVLVPETPLAVPVCLGGARACPPEDCGGPWGYQEMLAAVADPGHPEHEESKEWLGPEHWDAEAFHLDPVNRLLAQAFAPRKGRPARPSG